MIYMEVSMVMARSHSVTAPLISEELLNLEPFASTYSSYKMAAKDWTLHGTNYRRPLSDSEFAFYPSSQTGLGDM